MPTFYMHMADGSMVATACRRIRVEVDGQPFWFAVHESQSRAVKTVSHFASGMRVCDLPYEAAFAMHPRRDDREMACEALAHLAQRVGPARVRQMLTEAERMLGGGLAASTVHKPQG